MQDGLDAAKRRRGGAAVAGFGGPPFRCRLSGCIPAQTLYNSGFRSIPAGS